MVPKNANALSGKNGQGKAPPLQCSGHTRPIPSLSFSQIQPDGLYYLISSCKDGNPMLRDGMTGDWVGTFLGHKGAVWSAKMSGDASKAVSGSADFTAKVWNAYTGDCLSTLSHNHIVRAVDISSSGTHVVTGGHEKKIRVYDLERPDAPVFLSQDGDNESGKGSEQLAHDGLIKSVVWRDQGMREIASAADDGTFRFWDTRTRRPTRTIGTGKGDPIISMDRAHDSSLISLVTSKTVSFYAQDRPDPIFSHNLGYSPTAASLHPLKLDRFVTGSTDGRVRVHDATTGEEQETLKGHFGPVHSISFSPDGELYASGSEDGTIRLWQDTPKSYGLWRCSSPSNPQSGHAAEVNGG